jgi:tetratricopeptide (TPR) repeat protein
VLLANDLARLNDLRQARELHEQALAMHQRLHEGDHRDVAHSLNNLANLLRDLRENERAQELDEQALAMRQRIAERQEVRGTG